jgi:hypothetical protein
MTRRTVWLPLQCNRAAVRHVHIECRMLRCCLSGNFVYLLQGRCTVVCRGTGRTARRVSRVGHRCCPQCGSLNNAQETSSALHDAHAHAHAGEHTRTRAHAARG